MDLFPSFFSLFFGLALYVLGDHEDSSDDAASSSSSQDSESETSISYEYSASSSSSSSTASNSKSYVEGARPLNHPIVFDPLLERGAGKPTLFTPLNSAALETLKAAMIDPATVKSFPPVLIPTFQPNKAVFDSSEAAMVQWVEPASSRPVDPTVSTDDESESHLSVDPADETERNVSDADLSLDIHAAKMMIRS